MTADQRQRLEQLMCLSGGGYTPFIFDSDALAISAALAEVSRLQAEVSHQRRCRGELAEALAEANEELARLAADSAGNQNTLL